jgi:UDP-N-acetylglucosamine transferase subunit ALG13
LIVAVTGTGLPFPRLIDALTHYARVTGSDVWVQHGSANIVAPLRGDATIPRATLVERMRNADAVICHAGCGTLADAFAVGHVPVVVPRVARHGEHVNDHQLELFDVLSEQGRIVALREPTHSELSAALREARARRHAPSTNDRSARLQECLREDLDALASQASRHDRWRRIVLRVLRGLTRSIQETSDRP